MTDPETCDHEFEESDEFPDQEICIHCFLVCRHRWEEQPGEPPVDACTLCGAVRE